TMNAMNTIGLSKILSVSMLGLALAACQAVDEEPAGAPAPASAPAPAVEETFEVTSIAQGADGKPVVTKVQMTEAQWQQIIEQRKAAADSNRAPASGDPSVFVTRQAQTIFGNCSDPATTWHYSGSNQTGSRACVQGWWNDTGFPDSTLDVGFGIRSYITGNSGMTLICTGNSDCNVYTCRNGSSVWFNAGTCTNPYYIGCSGYVATPPPYYTARYV